jgi:thioredoxin-related protein
MKKSAFFSSFIIVFSFGCLHTLDGQCQENGIKFESGVSLQEVLYKAKLERKLVFIVCYATWCSPCKSMEQNIYPDIEVGDYFNTHFISIKIQMDRTPKDSADVCNWYNSADSLGKKYMIGAYPTYLFLEADGTPLSKLVGASDNKEEFISKAGTVQDANKQYYTILKNQQQHQEDSSFMFNAIFAALNAGDEQNARIFANNYFSCLKVPITKRNLDDISRFIISKSDKGFEIFLHNSSEIDSVSDEKDFAEKIGATVVFNEEMAPFLTEKGKSIDVKKTMQELAKKYSGFDNKKFTVRLDESLQSAIGIELAANIRGKIVSSQEWSEFSKDLKLRFPGYDCGKIVLSRETLYYYGKKLWRECCNAAITLVERYNEELGDGTTNDIVWMTIFKHSNDSSILNRALVIMHKKVEEVPGKFYSLDTYANLLYKTGHTSEAIDFENKALNVANSSGFEDDIKGQLDKMKRGEPTWDTANSGS